MFASPEEIAEGISEQKVRRDRGWAAVKEEIEENVGKEMGRGGLDLWKI